MDFGKLFRRFTPILIVFHVIANLCVYYLLDLRKLTHTHTHTHTPLPTPTHKVQFVSLPYCDLCNFICFQNGSSELSKFAFTIQITGNTLNVRVYAMYFFLTKVSASRALCNKAKSIAIDFSKCLAFHLS